MRKTSKRLFVLIMMIQLTPVSAALDTARQAELLYLLKHDCGSCHGMTRKGGLGHAQRGNDMEFVTGNNDADGVYLLQWVKQHSPEKADHIAAKLRQWGGNSSGVNIANIDNLGDVHPDTFWWHYSLGNVRQRPFSEIWVDASDPIMKGLKAVSRVIKGRCGECRYFDIFGGNTRVRALQLTDDSWAEDPACYLTDAEIRINSSHDVTDMPLHRAGAL